MVGRWRVEILVGTSGYSYREWKGRFYPEKLPAAKMLAYYGERFPTVEINNTFYRMPTLALLESWAGQVPESFRFVLKAPGRITHQGALLGVRDAVAYFVETASSLGDRAGPLLFQLPPSLSKDAARLRDFLALLPARTRAAFEFRHRSWYDDEVLAILRDRGVALCVADSDDRPVELDPDRDPGKRGIRIDELAATAGFGYLRLRRLRYTGAELRRWHDWVRTQPWDQAYVFFKHEEKATGVEAAQHFQSLGAETR